MIIQVLAFGQTATPACFPGPNTPGAVSLPAGLIVCVNHSRPHDPVRYWPPQPRPDWSPLPIRNTRWSRTFLRQQLEQVVEQHLQADVPVACLLSSGLDSGILTALASRLQPGVISSFPLALPVTPQDESLEARRMAQHCGSDHHELVIEPEQALGWVEQALMALQLASPRLAGKLIGLPRWDRWHLGLALRRWSNDATMMAAGLPPLHWPQSAPQRITQAWGQTSWAELFGYTEPMLLRDSDLMSMACGLDARAVAGALHQLAGAARAKRLDRCILDSAAMGCL